MELRKLVLLFTYTDLQIEKYIKGSPFAESRPEVVTPGGIVGEVGRWAEGQLIFHSEKGGKIGGSGKRENLS